MSAGAPWSVKGIDPKAREIAKDLARRSGMTLGEWLNQMILEDGSEADEIVAPLPRRSALYGGPDRRWRSRRLDDAYAEDGDPGRLADAVEEIAARLEAAERRSTLAISGVDQAVAGVLARLEQTERGQEALARRVDAAGDELRAGHDRLRRLETDGAAKAGEGLKVLESALGKIANQLYEGEARTRAALGELREELGSGARRLTRLEAEAPQFDPVAVVDDVVARVAERLKEAEARTSAAVRGLENSFAWLDERLRATETRLSPDREARLEALAEELSKRVAESRAELAASLEAAAAGRFDRADEALAAVTARVEAAERRSVQAVERMGHEVLRIAQNLNRRMTGVETGAAEAVRKVGEDAARRAEVMDGRLRRVEAGQAEALERLGSEIAKISERFAERVAHAERRSVQALQDMDERIGRVSDKLEARYDRASGEFAQRIRESEERTERLLAEARETVERELEAARRRADRPHQVWEEAPVAEVEPAPAPTAVAETPAYAPLTPDSPPAAVVLTAPHLRAEPAPPASPAQSFFDADLAPFPVVAETPPAFEETDPFEAETEFVSPRPSGGFGAFDAAEPEAAAKPPVSTREAIEAARAAARLGARNEDEGLGAGLGKLKLGGGGGKSRLQARIDKQRKGGDSTVKKAVLASATAATVMSALGGWYYIFADGDARRLFGGAPDAPAPTAEPAAAPLAAAALTDGALMSEAEAAAGGQVDPETLHAEAMRMIAAGEAQGAATLLRAANLGYAPAQYDAAKLYDQGLAGLPRDQAEARRWLDRAAQGGDRRAMYDLGLMAFDGVGGPKDMTLGAQWIQKAAEQGLVDAQYGLGRLHEQGLGVAKDDAAAYRWYRIAARSGDAESRAAAERLRPALTVEARVAADRAAQRYRPAENEAVALASR